MAEPFLGQVTMMAIPYAPKGYAFCNGQLLPVNQNQALFALLGVQYGGNGSTNFNLPDLRGRSPISALPSYDQSWNPGPYAVGQIAGSETVTLTTAQIPGHVHQPMDATATGNDGEPANGEALATGSIPLYAAVGAQVPLGGGPLQPAGGGQPHPNMQPYLTINMCVALVGIYPSRG